jgi:hypothetical protein
MKQLCHRCRSATDEGFWLESGGLCGGCLAANALPLTSLSGKHTISGTFTFKNQAEWTRTIQLMMGVEPSIKYGEHKWGAFA